MSLKEKLSEGVTKVGKAGLGLMAAGSLALGLPQESKSQEFQENAINNTLEYDGSGDKFRIGINYGVRSNNLPMGYTKLPSQAYHDANLSFKYGIDKDNSVGLMYGKNFSENEIEYEDGFYDRTLNPNFDVVKLNYKNDLSSNEKLVGGIGFYPGGNHPQDHPVNNHFSVSGSYSTEIDGNMDIQYKMGSLIDLTGQRENNSYFSDLSISKTLEGTNIYTENRFEVGTKGVINGLFGDDGHAGSIYGKYTFENNPYAQRSSNLYLWNASIETQYPFAVNFGLNLRFTTD